MANPSPRLQWPYLLLGYLTFALALLGLMYLDFDSDGWKIPVPGFALNYVEYRDRPVPPVALACAVQGSLLVLSLGLAHLMSRKAPGLSDWLLCKLKAFPQSAYRLFSRGVILASLPVLLFVAAIVLRKFPNSADEYVFLFQADTYRAGRLWNGLHQLQEFFFFFWIAEKDGKWVGQYPPGWSAALTAASFLKLPYWSVSPLMGTLSLGAVYLLAKRLYEDKLITAVTVVTMAVSSFFVFNSASFFNHQFTFLFTTLFILFAVKYLDNPKWLYGLALGACIGAVGITRHFDTVLLALPFGLAVLWRRSLRHLLGLFWVALGASPFILALLWYNHAITGHALLPVQAWREPEDSIGFHSRYGEQHTPIRGILRALGRCVEWSQWTSPLMLVVYGIALYHKIRTRSVRFYDLYLPVFAIAFIFYLGDGGNRYGPRYWYAAYPSVLVLFSWAVVGLMRAELPSLWKRFGVHFLIMNTVVSVFYLPAWGRYMNRVITQRMDVYDQVEQKGIHNAIVFLKSPTGVILRFKTPDLTRNGIDKANDVLYVHNKGERNRELMQAYPGRNYWLYEREPQSPEGRLTPLSP